MDVVRRFRATRMPLGDQLRVVGGLAAGWAALGTRQVDRAWEHIERVHDASQNAGVLHSQAHLLRCAGLLARGRVKSCVSEVPLVVMAAPAAWVRRAAGVAPGEPGGESLWGTWELRKG